MAQYIDKAAVVAEIEKRITNIKEYCVREGHDRRFDVVPEQLSHILSFIDTIEVKEVEEEPSDDLEQEIENELERTWCGEYLDTDKFRESAKHFFEFGLKAQKGE